MDGMMESTSQGIAHQLAQPAQFQLFLEERTTIVDSKGHVGSGKHIGQYSISSESDVPFTPRPHATAVA